MTGEVAMAIGGIIIQNIWQSAKKSILGALRRDKSND